jgi:hypothetical protein
MLRTMLPTGMETVLVMFEEKLNISLVFYLIQFRQ